jgi:ubiquitin carboxyl-terminal hydrolase 8
MNLTKYKEKGYVGLTNLGNTCFLNSCIQVLNHTYELNEFLDNDNFKNILKIDLIDTVITNEWNDLKNIMWTHNGVISPNKFVFNVHRLAKEKNRELFTGFVQNDMTEFLLFVIECMHNSVSRSVEINIIGDPKCHLDNLAITCYNMLKVIYFKEYSELMELFYGIYVSNIFSKDGLITHSITPVTYSIIDLPIIHNKNHNIYDCFNLFTQQETLDGDNAWFNENTGNKEFVNKQILFWNFPKILIVTFNRFSQDGRQKLENLIHFPINNLDLSPYVCGYNKHQYVYDLYGVCNHYGGVMGGHYTAFAKNFDNKWVHYNDTIVDIIENKHDIITSNAYCLFYRKKL